MRLRVNFDIILTYFLGGLLGLIVVLVLLHLFHTWEVSGQVEHTFLFHWFKELPPTHGLSIIIGFVLAGFLISNWLISKDQLKIQAAQVKTLEEVSQAKTEMVSFASHQLRTPLSAVKFAAKMLLEGDFGKLNQDQQEILTKIYSASEELEELIGDFLDVSKLELGKLEISLKSISLADLEKELKGVIERTKLLIKEKNINFNELSFLNPKLFILADLKRISQVVETLLENAVNYTLPDGKIEIRLENDETLFKFSITDTGIGIPKEEQSKIFQKFFRAKNAKKIRSTGTGLGLYLCQRFIEEHQGKIWFISEEGKGTTFSFTIPLGARVEIEELFRKI